MGTGGKVSDSSGKYRVSRLWDETRISDQQEIHSNSRITTFRRQIQNIIQRIKGFSSQLLS